MKIYLELPQESRGIARVRDNLKKYLPPGATVVQDRKQADLIIFHVIGRHDMVEKQIENAISRGQKYAMIQYCLRSTMQPHTKEWIDMWSGAECVWSYYDLPALCKEDRGQMSDNFYYAPLGVEPVFYDRHLPREYSILSCSQGVLTESAKECIYASKGLGRTSYYLGYLPLISGVVSGTGHTDDELASIYSRCEFVSGLRRVEGFELPVIEGLMCGARPVVFDKPHYRHWFSEFSVFIKERDRLHVTNDINRVIASGARPVTQAEQELARDRFNWKTIITNFYNKL